jgi:hypothetical protein
MYNLELSWRLRIVKFSRATSRVKWLKGEKTYTWSRGSSGRLRAGRSGDRGSTGAEDFSSSPYVQTGSGAHPASYPMGTGALSPGIKRGRGVTLTTHPHLVPRLRMSRSYTSSPPICLHGV